MPMTLLAVFVYTESSEDAACFALVKPTSHSRERSLAHLVTFLKSLLRLPSSATLSLYLGASKRSVPPSSSESASAALAAAFTPSPSSRCLTVHAAVSRKDGTAYRCRLRLASPDSPSPSQPPSSPPLPSSSPGDVASDALQVAETGSERAMKLLQRVSELEARVAAVSGCTTLPPLPPNADVCSAVRGAFAGGCMDVLVRLTAGHSYTWRSALALPPRAHLRLEAFTESSSRKPQIRFAAGGDASFTSTSTSFLQMSRHSHVSFDHVSLRWSDSQRPLVGMAAPFSSLSLARCSVAFSGACFVVCEDWSCAVHLSGVTFALSGKVSSPWSAVPVVRRARDSADTHPLTLVHKDCSLSAGFTWTHQEDHAAEADSDNAIVGPKHPVVEETDHHAKPTDRDQVELTEHGTSMCGEDLKRALRRMRTWSNAEVRRWLYHVNLGSIAEVLPGAVDGHTLLKCGVRREWCAVPQLSVVWRQRLLLEMETLARSGADVIAPEPTRKPASSAGNETDATPRGKDRVAEASTTSRLAPDAAQDDGAISPSSISGGRAAEAPSARAKGSHRGKESGRSARTANR